MIGKVLEQKAITDNLDTIVIQSVEDEKVFAHVIDHDGEDYVGKFVSINTTITELSNSNFGHIYPEGTIGTF